MAVIPFRSYAAVPMLVLVDLQQEQMSPPRGLALPEAAQALDKCRSALVHARHGLSRGIRPPNGSPFSNAASPFSRWIEGFEPTGADMVCERDRPSCFASQPFAEAMASASRIVMAGFAGETTCLSTIVDVFHRGKRITYLADALASQSIEDMNGARVHHAVGKLASLYGEVQTTAEWILSSGQSLRNAGYRNG